MQLSDRSVGAVVAFSLDGMLLASGSSDDTMIKLWQVADGQKLTTLHGHTHTVLSVAFSPDGTLLASGSHDKTIILWEISDKSIRQTFRGHADGITSVAFSPDGTRPGVGKSGQDHQILAGQQGP